MTQVLLDLGFSQCVTKARYGRKGKSHTVWHGPNITQKEALDRVNAYLRENSNVDGLVKKNLGF